MKLLPDLTPPGGWVYTQPESGYEIRSMSLTDFQIRIEAHRRANGYDLNPGWWEMIMAEMCLDPALTARFCAESDENVPVAMNVRDLLRFFRTMREWAFKKGFSKVPIEEARRRESICLSCPQNQNVEGCTGCQGVVRWLGEFLTEEEKTTDPDLKNCAICKCVLALKIHMPEDVIAEAEAGRPLDYPTHCWLAKG